MQRDDRGQQGARIKAQRYILTAAKVNDGCLQELGVFPTAMQRRPLAEVAGQARHLPPLYGPFWGQPKPRMTVTTHPCADVSVWYLAVSLANSG